LRVERRTDALVVVGAIIATGIATLLAVNTTLRAFQIGLGVLFLVYAWTADKKARAVPRLLRPATIAYGSLLFASINSSGLSDGDYRKYFTLWCLQAFGFALGMLFFRDLYGGKKATPAKPVDVPSLLRYSKLLFTVCLLAALLYWHSVGISSLGSNVEQSRVDAATNSSGYLRLVAFLMPAAITMLVAARHRRNSWLLVALGVVFLVGVGNRIPLVYFLFPLIAMAAIVGSKLGSGKLVALAGVLVVVVGLFGAYRIFSQREQLYQDPDYAVALSHNSYPGVAKAIVVHYAEVVPQNQILVKRLVDDGAIKYQFGASYFTLFSSVLPGHQTSPDMLIKQVSGSVFYGGGIPPTLAGEGYMNFGYAGVVLNAMAAMLLMRFWAMRVTQMRRSNVMQRRIVAVIYGYVITWCALAQISGFAGSATISLSAFLILIGLRHLGIHAHRRIEMSPGGQPSPSVGSAPTRVPARDRG
jgi:energy-converting hydrogenase Eha subunit C